MPKGYKYLIIADRPVAAEWEQALTETTGICHTCKGAYNVALFLARIAEPQQVYRKILHLTQQKGAARITDSKSSNSATIVKVKIY